jgi:hypothetical protein
VRRGSSDKPPPFQRAGPLEQRLQLGLRQPPGRRSDDLDAVGRTIPEHGPSVAAPLQPVSRKSVRQRAFLGPPYEQIEVASLRRKRPEDQHRAANVRLDPVEDPLGRVDHGRRRRPPVSSLALHQRSCVGVGRPTIAPQ